MAQEPKQIIGPVQQRPQKNNLLERFEDALGFCLEAIHVNGLKSKRGQRAEANRGEREYASKLMLSAGYKCRGSASARGSIFSPRLPRIHIRGHLKPNQPPLNRCHCT